MDDYDKKGYNNPYRSIEHLPFCAGPASAVINTIQQGNTVFIGEEGLDISAAMGPDTTIGWWASAAEIIPTFF